MNDDMHCFLGILPSEARKLKSNYSENKSDRDKMTQHCSK